MLNMKSRCFITPKNLSFVGAVLDMLEKHGVTELHTGICRVGSVGLEFTIGRKTSSYPRRIV